MILSKLLMSFAVVALNSGMLTAEIDTGPEQEVFKPITLNLVATDRDGHPVSDLHPSDLRIMDGKSPQRITLLRPNQNGQPVPLTVLFDLLSFGVSERGAMAQRLRDALATVPASTPLYLYCIGTDGRLYAVIPTTGTFSQVATDGSRTRLIGPILDKAFQQLFTNRRVDLNRQTELIPARLHALDNLTRQISQLAGRKQLLWISYGIPSTLRLYPEGFVDLSKNLRQLAAEFNQDNIAIYTMDPSLIPASLNREGLEILSAATGGRSFDGSDLTASFAQARTDGQSSYLLEYSPTQTGKPAGDCRNVRISTDRKGVRLLAQQVCLAQR